MEKVKITPWEVEGAVDYTKLIKDFGVSPITDKILNRIKKYNKNIPLALRRKIFFAHRDLEALFDEYDKGNKFFLYTGRSPSGPIHLGHLMPWIFTKWLQDTFDVDLYFQFPDEEKFLFKKNLTMAQTKEWLHENMLDVIALGFNPKKTHFLVDTMHANILYPLAVEVSKKITLSTAKAAFGFKDDLNIGAIFYTSMQAAPVMVPGTIKKDKNIPCLIPLAVDQDPHFRVARDVYPRLGFPKPSIIHSMFLPPLTGTGGKMSSSKLESAIFTTDDPKTVKNKINKYAFSGGKDTLEEHRKLGGNPDVDVCFQYLRMMFEEDDSKLEEIEKNYKSGKLLSGELKSYLINKINAFLKEHQKKREEAKSKINDFLMKVE